MSLLSWLLVTLAGLSLAAMVVSLIIANRAAREARSTIFPIVREEETVRARRARIATSVTGVIAAIMAGAFFLSGQFPSPAIMPQKAPEQAVAEAEAPAAETEPPPAATGAPAPPTDEQAISTNSQVVPSPSPTQPPSATPTRIPPTSTSTPAPSPTATRVPRTPTPTSPPATAPASVQMGPIAFTTQVTDRHEPINSTTIFSDTISRVFATFPYSGMRDGLNWSHIWYFNGVEFSRGEDTWEWGSTDRSYVYTKLVGAGDYRLEIYVNDDLLASGEFTVQGPMAVGGPEDSESLETPQSSETPETPEGSKTLESPEGSETPETPEALETPTSP